MLLGANGMSWFKMKTEGASQSRNRLIGLGAVGFAMVLGCVAISLGYAWVGAVIGAMAAWEAGVRSSYNRQVRALSRQVNGFSETVGDLEHRLNHDLLTGHLNRSAFNAQLADYAKDHGEAGLIILIFFDLNRFKQVNDTLGHEVGDLLLIEVGRRAAEVLGKSALLARLGGDEFAAMIPWRSDEQADQCGRALVDAMNQPFRLQERTVEVSASVGLAIGDPAVHGCDELLRRADFAMYEVKGKGGGAYHIFDDLLSHRQLRENTIRIELGKSCFSDRFELHYQPIISARGGAIEKAEALLRTKASTLAGVSPALMVSVAEDSGQIVELTDWTLECALEASHQMGLPVAVNLSPLYIRHANFTDRVIDRMLASGAHPSSLIIEVTEGVLISDIKATREAIDQLRAIGIQVYLDDFGTGYSSLSYLQNFELDGLKFDRSFVQELGRNDRSVRIIRSMIDVAHTLNMKTVIEGVESEWQARILQLQGCDFLQGYQFGVPMPLPQFLQLLDQQRQPEQASLLQNLNAQSG